MGSPIEWLQTVGDEKARKLSQAGFETAEQVKDADMADLVGIDGIGPTGAIQLHEAAIIEPQQDRLTYPLEIERELWESWKETIDDDIPIDAELRSLIRRRVQNYDDTDDAEKIAGIRARQCTMRAMQSVAKDNQKARDELSEIMTLMDRIVG